MVKRGSVITDVTTMVSCSEFGSKYDQVDEISPFLVYTFGIGGILGTVNNILSIAFLPTVFADAICPLLYLDRGFYSGGNDGNPFCVNRNYYLFLVRRMCALMNRIYGTTFNFTDIRYPHLWSNVDENNEITRWTVDERDVWLSQHHISTATNITGVIDNSSVIVVETVFSNNY